MIHRHVTPSLEKATSYMENKLVWKNNTIYSRSKLNSAIAYIRRNMRGYLPLYPRERRNLDDYAKRNNIDKNTMVALRAHALLQKSVYRKYPASIKEKIITELAALDKRLGNSKVRKNVVRDMLETFEDLDVPMNLINMSFRKVPIDDYNNDTLKQYMKEFFGGLKQEEEDKRIAAENHEVVLQEYLKKHNIEFLTEKDMIARGSKTTPDIVFETPLIVTLDGHDYPIKWMDAKNFPLAPEKFFMDKLEKQAKKYKEAHGPGAFVFKGGIDNLYKIDGIIMLDGSVMYL